MAAMNTTPPASGAQRSRNRRGQGERLREDILTVTLRLLDELADDQALSLRAVAREAGVAATSVYLHFADHDALVLAAMERCHGDLTEAVDKADTGADGDPVASLRARTLVMGAWAFQHPGLYKVLHESTINQRANTSFRYDLTEGSTAAVQRCMDAGLAPADDAAAVALDLRAAVHGAVSIRLNQSKESGRQWPPLEEQVERFLVKLVGVARSGAGASRR
jgi:AcrR family transcriptional regulator